MNQSLIHTSSLFSDGDEEGAAEALRSGVPWVGAGVAGRLGEAEEAREVVLVGALRVEALALGELDTQVERRDVDRLRAEAFEVHLDAARLFVVTGDVAEATQVEIRAQLAVDAREEVEVEGGGDTVRIVVGGFERRAVFT